MNDVVVVVGGGVVVAVAVAVGEVVVVVGRLAELAGQCVPEQDSSPTIGSPWDAIVASRMNHLIDPPNLPNRKSPKWPQPLLLLRLLPSRLEFRPHRANCCQCCLWYCQDCW